MVDLHGGDDLVSVERDRRQAGVALGIPASRRPVVVEDHVVGVGGGTSFSANLGYAPRRAVPVGRRAVPVLVYAAPPLALVADPGQVDDVQLAGAGVYLKVGNARVCAVEPYLFDQGIAVLDAVVYAQVRVVDVQRADVRPVRHVHPARAVVDPDHVGHGVADVKRARDVVDALVAEGGRRAGGVRRLLGVGRFARQALRPRGGQCGRGGYGQYGEQCAGILPSQSGHRWLAPPPPRVIFAAGGMPGAPHRALITGTVARSGCILAARQGRSARRNRGATRGDSVRQSGSSRGMRGRRPAGPCGSVAAPCGTGAPPKHAGQRASGHAPTPPARPAGPESRRCQPEGIGLRVQVSGPAGV